MRCFDEKTAPQRGEVAERRRCRRIRSDPRDRKDPRCINPVLSRRLHPVWPQQKHDASDQAAEIGFAIATARPRRSDRAGRRHSLMEVSHYGIARVVIMSAIAMASPTPNVSPITFHHHSGIAIPPWLQSVVCSRRSEPGGECLGARIHAVAFATRFI